jgi:hypothetical protein
MTPSSVTAALEVLRRGPASPREIADATGVALRTAQWALARIREQGVRLSMDVDTGRYRIEEDTMTWTIEYLNGRNDVGYNTMLDALEAYERVHPEYDSEVRPMEDGDGRYVCLWPDLGSSRADTEGAYPDAVIRPSRWR